MRLDKYLKVSRMIKRRTVASEACSQGRIKVNEKVAKSSYDVKIGDVIEITYGSSRLRAQVTDISEHVGKADAASLYKVLDSEGEL